MRTGPVYLVRHGQAGSRQDYDQLSSVGVRQAESLGKYFRENGVHFETVISGSLHRQQQTARIVASALGLAQIKEDKGWSEFNLEEVFESLAPLLAGEDPAFASEYDLLQREMQKADSAVHREWTKCDVAVFKAWTTGRHEFGGETFTQFCARILAAGQNLLQVSKPALVFTSATPIGLTLAWAQTPKGQPINERKAMQFAGEVYNTAWSELRAPELEVWDTLSLVSFNNIPHLEQDDLKTLR